MGSHHPKCFPLILASPSRFSACAEDQVLPNHWQISSQQQGDSTFRTPGNRNTIWRRPELDAAFQNINLSPSTGLLQCKMRVIKPACCPRGDFEAWSCNLRRLLWSWEVLLCVKLEHDVSIDLKALYTKRFNSFQNCTHASQNYLPVHKAAM